MARDGHRPCGGRTRSLLIALILISIPSGYPRAQSGTAPKHEVRAVWLTTLLGLDWPSSSLAGNETAQKESLRDILTRVREKKLNTVIFQVRSRGNAFFRSSMEPWASELTGRLGKDPGWDPLAFAIDEAHALGLEVHAWVNIGRLWTGTSPPPRTDPPHLYHSHPGWVKQFREEFWLDPGIPEAREFTVALCTDIAGRYDLDGLHLDYIRYPEVAFPDESTYRRYGNGKDRDDWRRGNINSMVEEIYRKVTALKPWLKIGSAPIGIYRNIPGARGWQAFSSVYQDSRRWMREGYHDYIAPQIYWGLASNGSRIDFEALVRDWRENSAGRHVYVGIAAYRQEVSKHLAEHIDVCRKHGVEGSCFFRYRFLLADDLFADRYERDALVPPLAWKSNPPCPAVRALTVEPEGTATRITWQAPAHVRDDASPVRFALYRSDRRPVDIHDPESLTAILPATRTSYVDRAGGGKKYYAVTAINRYNVESRPADEGVASAIPPTLASTAAPRTAVSGEIRTRDGRLMLLGFTLARYGHVRLRLINRDGGEIQTLIDEKMESGFHVVGMESVRVTEESAGFIFEAGEYRVVRQFSADQ